MILKAIHSNGEFLGDEKWKRKKGIPKFRLLLHFGERAEG